MRTGIWIEGEEFREAVSTTYNALFDAKLIARSADMIAYTEDFERLFERVRPVYPATRNEVFTALMNSRKRSDLVKTRARKQD